MYSRFACYLLIISSVLSTTAYTAVNFQNINQLLDHVETLSPEIQKAKANLEVISARRLLAAQIPNPRTHRWELGREGQLKDLEADRYYCFAASGTGGEKRKSN